MKTKTIKGIGRHIQLSTSATSQRVHRTVVCHGLLVRRRAGSVVPVSGVGGEWCCWGVLLTLCTHRLKYPHQTIAALAASSPIEAILSFDQFDVLVAQAAGPECARSLRVATEAVEKALISDKVCHCQSLCSVKNLCCCLIVSSLTESHAIVVRVSRCGK